VATWWNHLDPESGAGAPVWRRPCGRKSLKLRAAAAERAPVFFPRSAPLRLAAHRIRGLRLSLNTPVVATEELPIGPARAAILVHDDPDAGPQVTIGLRSLRAERTVFYAFEGDLREASSFAVALDGALSFAESMGFLFDEDELGAGGAVATARCLALWQELLGEEPAAGEAADEPEELLLEQLADDAAPADPTDAPESFSEGEAPGAAPFDGATDVYVPPVQPPDAASPARPRAAAAPRPGPPARSAASEDDEVSFAGLLDDSEGEVPAHPARPAAPRPVSRPTPSGPAPVRGPAPHAPPQPAAPSLRAPTGPVRRPVPSPPAPERPSAPPPAAAAAPPVGLSKFRVRPRPAPDQGGAAAPETAPAPAAPAAPRATALGKLRLVRRQRGGGGGARKRHPILRLFGSF